MRVPDPLRSTDLKFVANVRKDGIEVACVHTPTSKSTSATKETEADAKQAAIDDMWMELFGG